MINKKIYTNVYRNGKNIRYIGYEDGKRVQRTIPFKPTLYVTSIDPQSEWKSLDGMNVEPINFGSMKEASDFVKQDSDVDKFGIYGNTNFVSQYINQEFPGTIKWDPKHINITSALPKQHSFCPKILPLYHTFSYNPYPLHPLNSLHPLLSINVYKTHYKYCRLMLFQKFW